MSLNGLRIGVTMRVVETQAYHEPRDALAQDWARFISAALPEAAWLPVPNLGTKKARDYCNKWGINRLILSGGEDIGVSVIRDQTEKDLLTWASTSDVPVLGICRGLQIMAVSAGVALKAVAGHVCTHHILHGDISHKVNSFHNFGLAECPFGYEVSARSEDGEIEAIVNATLRWEGWMWHPERETVLSTIDIERIRILFS